MGDGPFWGLTLVGWSDWNEVPEVEGVVVPLLHALAPQSHPTDIVSFSASLWFAIHCCLCCSLPSFSAPSAESGGSGDAFLLRRLEAAP